MNKIKMKCLNLLPLAVLAALIVASCQEKTVQSEISDALGINVRNETVLSLEDTSGGWLGDGWLIVSLQITDEAVASQITESWDAMPLTENMTVVVYGRSEGDKRYRPWLCDASGNPLIPQIENGRYRFIDRHSNAADPSDDTDVLSRHSVNFTIAIFDADTNVLYYVEIDS